ncbi:MAG: hypothetical protein ILP23_06660, partial [Paludibacteraceae bacterium]|nr:hypothetical protein [Paludibacteraceae bacterium]
TKPCAFAPTNVVAARATAKINFFMCLKCFAPATPFLDVFICFCSVQEGKWSFIFLLLDFLLEKSLAKI